MSSQNVNMTAKFLDLEQQLTNMLNPVRPNPEFVSNLRYRLVNPTHIELERPRNNALVFLTVSMGLVGGILFWWIIRRFH